MDIVISQFQYEKSEIYILGLVKLGNNLSLKLLAGVVTYVVYLVQFQVLENKKTTLQTIGNDLV